MSEIDTTSCVDKGHARSVRQGREGNWLIKRGFDGLYNPGECACLADDLYPCGERGECYPGVKKPCPEDCGEHDWHIGKKVAPPSLQGEGS